MGDRGLFKAAGRGPVRQEARADPGERLWKRRSALQEPGAVDAGNSLNPTSFAHWVFGGSDLRPGAKHAAALGRDVIRCGSGNRRRHGIDVNSVSAVGCLGRRLSGGYLRHGYRFSWGISVAMAADQSPRRRIQFRWNQLGISLDLAARSGVWG